MKKILFTCFALALLLLFYSSFQEINRPALWAQDPANVLNFLNLSRDVIYENITFKISREELLKLLNVKNDINQSETSTPPAQNEVTDPSPGISETPPKMPDLPPEISDLSLEDFSNLNTEEQDLITQDSLYLFLLQARKLAIEGNYVSSLELLNVVERIQPDNVLMLNIKGSVYYKQNLLENAALYWSKSLAQSPNQPLTIAYLDRIRPLVSNIPSSIETLGENTNTNLVSPDDAAQLPSSDDAAQLPSSDDQQFAAPDDGPGVLLEDIEEDF